MEVSTETRSKISKGNRGKKLSNETKLKISQSAKDRKKPKGHGEKISAFRKNSIWITDGKTNVIVNKDSVIPAGWRRGMTKGLAK